MKLKISGMHKPEPGAGSPDKGLLKRIIDYGLLALLVLSPLPAASVPAWAILAIQLTVLAMTGAYVLMNRKPSLNPFLAERLKWPRYAFFGLFAFLAIQIVPLPRFITGILSPGTAAFHRTFAPDFAKIHFLSLSVVPAQTLRAGLELAAYVLLGFLVLKTVTRGYQIRRILAVLVVMGSFEALYGMFELTTKTPRILFYKKVFNQGFATGTFVNQNHMAGYLEMIVPLAIGLLIARLGLLSLGGEGLKDKILHMTGKGLLSNALLFIAVIVMSLGILLSRSRSGLFILAFTFLLFIEFIVLHFGRFGPRQRWIRNFVWGLFAVVTASALYIGIGATIQRFAADNLLRESRSIFWSNATGIIAGFPLFGSGLGTFVSVYPAYEKIPGPELLLTHAHNDYIEYLSELGIVGMALLLGGILYLGIQAFRSWRERRDPESKGIAMGGIISLVVILLHSLTDFNLHIPANMLLFAVVLPLTVVTAFHRKNKVQP